MSQEDTLRMLLTRCEGERDDLLRQLRQAQKAQRQAEEDKQHYQRAYERLKGEIDPIKRDVGRLGEALGHPNIARPESYSVLMSMWTNEAETLAAQVGVLRQALWQVANTLDGSGRPFCRACMCVAEYGHRDYCPVGPALALTPPEALARQQAEREVVQAAVKWRHESARDMPRAEIWGTFVRAVDSYEAALAERGGEQKNG